MPTEVVRGDGGEHQARAGRPARRPADPTTGSLALVVRPRATSPWLMIRPWSAWMYSGRRSRFTKLSTRRCGMACRAARAVRSTACPIRRAARLTSRCRSSDSAKPSRRATSAISPSSSRSKARPERQVQGVAYVQQPVVRLAYPLVRTVGQPGGRERPQHAHVPDAAAGLLEVGFEQVGRVPEHPPALLQRRQQLRQPDPRIAPPGVQQRSARALDQGGVAGDPAQIEQADPGAQLLAGDLGALGRRTHRVIQADPRVPQRVPESVGQLVDLLGRLAVVQQHQVDVGPWSELVPGQAADRRPAPRRSPGRRPRRTAQPAPSRRTR